MATLVMTAPITELVTGHDLSHLTINLLPHTLVALEILGVTLYPFAARRLAPDVSPGSGPGTEDRLGRLGSLLFGGRGSPVFF
ncbi:MAG: hypothetical protein R3F31_15055 [Verrucomicrobiales bacterium]